METILFIQSFKNPFLDYLFQAVTMLGEQSFFIIMACWFTWCYDKKTGWRIGFIFLTGTALNGILKNIFCITRPIGRDNIVSLRTHTAEGFSFPSGHTQNAALFWFSLMKIYRKKYLYITGMAVVIIVGVSRLYLGVHWPSDVIGGALIGAAWVAAADFIWNKFKIAESKTAAALVMAVMLSACIFFPDKYIIRTTGAAAGFLAGIYLDRKYLDYPSSQNNISQVFKMAAGLAVIFLIMLGGRMLLPAGFISQGISFALIGFWITFGAPYIFARSWKVKNSAQ